MPARLLSFATSNCWPLIPCSWRMPPLVYGLGPQPAKAARWWRLLKPRYSVSLTSTAHCVPANPPEFEQVHDLLSLLVGFCCQPVLLFRAQRALGPHPILEINAGEQRSRLRIRSAHAYLPRTSEVERNHIRANMSAGEKFNSLLVRQSPKSLAGSARAYVPALIITA